MLRNNATEMAFYVPTHLRNKGCTNIKSFAVAVITDKVKYSCIHLIYTFIRRTVQEKKEMDRDRKAMI